MYLFFGILIVALVVMGFTVSTVAGLLVGVFFVGATSAALSPIIQTRLMDVARDSQSIAAALNHSALNIGNALGALLGGIAIGAGLGYVAPIWIGLGLSVAGLLLAVATFAIDRARRTRGVEVPYGTAALARSARPERERAERIVAGIRSPRQAETTRAGPLGLLSVMRAIGPAAA